MGHIIANTIFYSTALSQAGSLTSSPNQPTAINPPISTLLEPSAASIEVSVKKLDRELYKIERQVFSTIKQQKLPIDEILNWIRFPPMSLRPHFAKLTEMLSKSLLNVSSVDELFFVLPQYWNSLHPAILEHFVDMLEDVDLQIRMQQYMNNLRQFRKHTTIGNFLDIQWVGEIPSDYQEFIVELGESWREKTVEDLMQLQVRISRLKGIGGGYMPLLKTARSSSIHIVFALPNHVFPFAVKQKTVHDFLKSEDVLNVLVDGQCVIDFIKLVSCATVLYYVF